MVIKITHLKMLLKLMFYLETFLSVTKKVKKKKKTALKIVVILTRPKLLFTY